MKRWILPLFSLTLIAGCSDTGDGTPTEIPDIQMTCATTKCKAQPTASYDAYAIITLSGCKVDAVDLDSVVAGSASANCVNGVGCTATVASWRDNNGNAATQIPSRSYYICSRLNFDGNIAPSAGDEFAEVRKTIISDDPIISDSGTWGIDAFSRSLNND